MSSPTAGLTVPLTSAAVMRPLGAFTRASSSIDARMATKAATADWVVVGSEGERVASALVPFTRQPAVIIARPASEVVGRLSLAPLAFIAGATPMELWTGSVSVYATTPSPADAHRAPATLHDALEGPRTDPPLDLGTSFIGAHVVCQSLTPKCRPHS